MSNKNKNKNKEVKEEAKTETVETEVQAGVETEVTPEFNPIDELNYIKGKIEVVGDREIDLAVESAHKAIGEAVRWLEFIAKAQSKKKK